MARYHNLEERKLPIDCGDTLLIRISCRKLLGVYMDQHLTWKTRVDQYVKFTERDTVSTAQALKFSPFSCEETPGRELSPLSSELCMLCFSSPSSISNEALFALMA